YPFAHEHYWIAEVVPPTAHPDDGRPEESRAEVVQRHEPAAEHPVGTVQLIPVWSSETVAHLDQERIPRFPSLQDRVAIVGAVAAGCDELVQALPEAHFLDLQPGDSIDDMVQKLAAVGCIDHIVWIVPHEPLLSLAEDRIIEAQERGVLL